MHKKIAFIINSPYTLGGMQRVVTSLANSLISKNYDITIICTEITDELKTKNAYNLNKNVKVILVDKGKSVKDLFARVLRRINRYTGLLKFNFCTQYYAKFYFPVKLKNSIRDKLKKENYDYVIALGGYYSILLGLLKDELKNSICVGWQHNTYEAYFETRFKYHYNEKNLFKHYTKKLDAVVVLTDFDANEYKNNFNINAKRIYNPLTTFASNEISNLDSNIIVSVSRISIEQKGLDYLLEIFEKIKAYKTDAKLKIVGGGEDFSKLKDMVEKSKYCDDIELTGQSNEVEKILRLSNVFVSTSRWEGFGLVITEALSCGLPIVSFDNSGPSEIINKNGVNGFIIPKYDLDEFAKTVVKLLNDRNLAYSVQNEAVLRAKDFKSEKIACEWIGLLNDIEEKNE